MSTLTPEIDPDSIFAAAAEAPEEQAQRFEASVDTTGVDVFDHSVEREAIKEADAADGIHIPDQPAHLSAPINNPAMMADADAAIKVAMESSFKGTFDMKDVIVTPEERERFVRAALHDEEMWFDITMTGVDMTVRIAIPPESVTTSVGGAAHHWAAIGFNDKESDMQWLLSFQQMHAWFQVREIDGVATAWSDMFCDGIPKLSAMRAFLKNPDNFEMFFTMGAVRWRLLVESMRIAEFKYKLCLEAWQDRSFFTTAGTA